MTSCLVFTSAAGDLSPPSGERLMHRSLTSGLRRMGCEVANVPSLRRLALERLRFWRDPTRADLLFTDPWKLQAACEHHLLGSRALERCLVLEWFGTPPERTAPPLGPEAAPRYLMPYAYEHGWNSFLGFVLHEGVAPVLTDGDALRERLRTAHRRKKRQGVVWGKEARYLEGRGELLARLADLGPVHVTAAPTGPLALPRHPGIVSRGVLSPEAWRDLLAESSYLIGLGDPVLGPSPLEALAEGCVYIDPRYASPRHVNGRPELPVCSQHPFAAAIGRPFVLEVDLQDHRSVQAAVEASFQRLPPPESSAWDAVVDALVPFTVEPYAARLRAIVERWRAR